MLRAVVGGVNLWYGRVRGVGLEILGGLAVVVELTSEGSRH